MIIWNRTDLQIEICHFCCGWWKNNEKDINSNNSYNYIIFLSAASFLITKTDVALTLWELFTVIGAIVYLVFFVCLSEKLSFDSLYKRLSSIFMTCALVLTSVAHTVNITVLSNGFKSAHTG